MCRTLYGGLSWGAGALILGAAGWAVVQNAGYSALLKVMPGEMLRCPVPTHWVGHHIKSVLKALQDWAANSALGKSGFLAAFALIFLSEIGDKTFFIAALLAMKVPSQSRSLEQCTAFVTGAHDKELTAQLSLPTGWAADQLRWVYGSTGNHDRDLCGHWVWFQERA